jgi:hypothetical protein
MSIFLACRRMDSLSARRNFHAPRLWQRTLLAFYVILLGLIMPFICWGAQAEPGHPHQLPHFVFTDPVMVMPALAQGAAATKPHSMQEHLQMLERQQKQSNNPDVDVLAIHQAAGDLQEAEPASEDSAPVGRSTLKLLLFSLLTLVADALWKVIRIDMHYALLLSTYLFTKLCGLDVPVPPPRCAVPA